MTQTEQIKVINEIRESTSRSKLFDQLSLDDRREFLELIGGDVKWLDELLKDFVEVKKTARAETE